MWCPQCGQSNEESAKFCNGCGLDFAKYREQWQSPETQAPAGQTPAYQPPDQQQYQPPYQQQPYQQQPYQQQPYQQQQYRPMSSYGTVPRVPSYMGWAIAVLILCFWPTGIAAVVYASQVGNKLAIGDIAGAQESSRKAKMWCWISFIIAIIVIVIAVIVSVTAGGRIDYGF